MPYKFFVMLMGWSNHDIRLAIYQIFLFLASNFLNHRVMQKKLLDVFSSFNFYLKNKIKISKKLSNVITLQVTRQRE